MMKWMKKAFLRLRNEGQIKVEVNLTMQSPKLEAKLGDPKEITDQQEKETTPEMELELESEQTPNFGNKDHFLKYVNAKDCIKAKVTRCFKMQF